jgi:aldose 1-epimerase
MEGAFAESDRRYGIPGTAQVVEGNGGLPKVHITSSEVIGEMYLHGAHITSWKPAGGEEVLFLSSQSRWKHGQAIRGGVPVCFPWFGGKADDPTAPAHGFVRTKAWQLESIAQVGGEVTVSMSTESDEGTKRWWPAEFQLVHRVTFGRELSLELEVTNTGRTSLRFEEALHAYRRVGNIEKTRIRGLDTVHYLDKTDSNRKKLQHNQIVIVSETDRVLPEHQGCNRTGRSCITSSYPHYQGEFTHDRCVEPMGAEGTFLVRFCGWRMDANDLYRNQQRFGFCRGSRARSATQNESSRQSCRFLNWPSSMRSGSR